MTRWTLLLLWSAFVVGAPPTAAAGEKTDSEASPPAATSVLAGFLQHAEGDVAVEDEPADLASGRLFHLGEGKRLRTGDGRAELTLSIGSFFRVGPHSEVEMLEAGLQAASLRLHRGEIVVDVSSLVDQQTSSVLVNNNVFRFEKAGLYRLALAESGAITIQVSRGRATHTAGAEATTVTKGKSLLLDSNGGSEAGEAPSTRDEPLLAWSKERRKLLRQQERREGNDPFSNPEVDRELRRMRTNRPVGTVVVGP